MTVILGGCPSPGPSLDSAVSDYLDARRDSLLTSCDCYEFLIDLQDPGGGVYSSREDCLASIPAPSDEAITCVKDVLASSSYDSEGQVSVIECYAEAVREGERCLDSKFEDGCSEGEHSDCAMKTEEAYGACKNTLSTDQNEALGYCIAQ